MSLRTWTKIRSTLGKPQTKRPERPIAGQRTLRNEAVDRTLRMVATTVDGLKSTDGQIAQPKTRLVQSATKKATLELSAAVQDENNPNPEEKALAALNRKHVIALEQSLFGLVPHEWKTIRNQRH